MGLYQRFGSSAGSGVPATIIPIDTVPTTPLQNGKSPQVSITDFGVASSLASEDTVAMLELSTDGFTGSIVEVSRIEVPTNGTVYKTFGRPIPVQGGQSLRVRFSQGTPGTVSAELFGEINRDFDITDV